MLGGTGGVKTFGFKKSQYQGRNMRNNGAAMEVYTIMFGGAPQKETLEAFWCPYQANNFLGTTLPGVGGPNLMFTFAMDGCTFVAGSVTKDNSVTVHHVNMMRSGSALGTGATSEQRAEQQRKMQRNISRSLVTNPSMLEPDDYYDPTTRPVVIPPDAKINTVTFGRRSSSGAWKFYTHQYYTIGSDNTSYFIGTQRVI